MPTIFTAIQSHARKVKPRKSKRQILPEAQLPPQQILEKGLQPAAAAGRPVPPTKKARRHRGLSLADRFKIIGKPASCSHVIVVGAGFAGLSAAYELTSVGYKVTVVEAQRRVGGRVESRRNVVTGEVVECGAELIGLNHPAWWSYKRKFGLRFTKLSDAKYSPVILGGVTLCHGAAQQLIKEQNRAVRLISAVARPVNAHRPWITPGAKKLDRRSLVQGLNSISMSSQCRLAFLEQLQADNGVAAKNQSWLGNLAMIKGGGLGRYWTDTETHHCKRGNQRLAEKFKSKLKVVHLGKRVHTIQMNQHGAEVFVEGRKKPLIGSDVVLAIPPTKWRGKHGIHFNPPLRKAYRVQFGKNVKFILNVRRDSWKPEDPDMTTDGPIDMTWDGTDRQPGARAGFVAFSGAENARICRRWGNHKKEYLKTLATVYPGLKAASRKGLFMDWPNNEWTHGSYSFPKPGEVTRVGPLLRAGIQDILHFAGEHTCYAFTGYMEGALQSGLRVAEYIARRDRVIRLKSGRG
jgi:monoamine oxidase